jgi:porphobilinogen deaminase
MRSEPVAWSARVITASPPAARTASAISAESVATATGPMSASIARRQTCTIIGRPWISAIGLRGRRVAAMRKAYMPGTIMAYAGVGRPDTRADMVAYLNSLADAPKPLPKP